MRAFSKWIGLSIAVLGVSAGAARQARADLSLILNGGFDQSGGSLASWTVVNQSLSNGNWFVQSGTSSPTSGYPVPAPPEGTHAAMTDEGGPGSYVLYQDFVVPLSVSAATLSFDKFIGNRYGSFVTPSSLDFTGGANQQARVDIITTTASPFSVAAGDVLLNVFKTNTGDQLVNPGYSLVSTDLTSFLTAHAGQTLRLRFAVTDNQFFFQFGVDAVSLNVTPGVTAAPEPSTLAGAATGILMVVGYTWRRRRAAP